MSDELWAEIVEILEQAAWDGEWADYGDRPALEAACELASIIVAGLEKNEVPDTPTPENLANLEIEFSLPAGYLAKALAREADPPKSLFVIRRLLERGRAESLRVPASGENPSGQPL